MPIYTHTVTATHHCRRCGATASCTEPTAPGANRAMPHVAGWRNFPLPSLDGATVRVELCPQCVAAVAAFVLPGRA